jgi:flagellar biosynthesis protein FlhF
MKIKKYTASSMPEAMKQIRAELGSDAVILNSRVIQHAGFFGLFRKNSIEVIAAMDPEATVSLKSVEQERMHQKKIHQPPLKVNERKETTNLQAPSSEADSTDILKELALLKEMLRNNGTVNNVPGVLPEPLRRQVEQFRDQELSPVIIEELSDVLLEKWYLNGAAASETEVRQWSAAALSERLIPQSFGGLTFTKKFVNVIGPTGVGKTTTLAKIAADCVLNYKKKIAFITTDTYRIAAIEQLKTYAKILDVPIEVCYNMEDFKKAAEKLSDYDLVFIDTAGRNFRNQKYVADLTEAIDFSKNIETYLVLSLTSKQRDMEEIRKQFSLIPIDRFIFTKVDETAVYGAMVNMSEKFSTGIAYLTNGQDVPDDLIEASPTIIIDRILGDNSYE